MLLFFASFVYSLHFQFILLFPPFFFFFFFFSANDTWLEVFFFFLFFIRYTNFFFFLLNFFFIYIFFVVCCANVYVCQRNYIIYIGVETFDLIYTKEEEKKNKKLNFFFLSLINFDMKFLKKQKKNKYTYKECENWESFFSE